MKGTHLIRALREAIENPDDTEHDIIYFPWYETEKESGIAKIAVSLGVPLIVASSVNRIPDNCRGLLSVLDALQQQCGSFLKCDSVESMKLALRDWPESEGLRMAARDRIRSVIQRAPVKALMSFCPRSPSAVQWQSEVIALFHELGVRRIVVCGAIRPPVQTRDVRTLWAGFYDDFQETLSTLVEEQFLQGQDRNSRGIEPSKSIITENKAIRRFAEFLGRALGLNKNSASSTPPPSSPGPRPEDRWYSLIARLCFPNQELARETLIEWGSFESKSDELNDDEAPSLEQQTLRERGQFLTMLYRLWPEVYNASLNELDGADQLYRLHLALFGGTAPGSLLNGMLLPRWRANLEDPALRDFFFDCFGGSSGYRPLVQRFESRTQLSKHLVWHDSVRRRSADRRGVGPQDEPSPAEATRNAFYRWVTEVQTLLENVAQRGSRLTPSVDSDLDLGLTKALSTFGKNIIDRIQDDANLHSGEALEFAQMLMTAYELLSDVDELSDQAGQCLLRIGSLVDRALMSSQGALRFEATLLRARVLAVQARFLEAQECIRPLRGIASDPLADAAIGLEVAFMLERSGDFIRSVRQYQEVLNQAEAIGADELSARSVLGQLRCDYQSGELAPEAKSADPTIRRRGRLRMRAQAMVQIQTARAPELFALSPRARLKLFLSYRKPTQAITEKFAGLLREPIPPFAPWWDGELAAWQDFSPVIHRELLASDAIVLVIGSDFFQSEWCIHELNFALGQHRMQGIPIFWLWCELETQHDKYFGKWARALDCWREGFKKSEKMTSHMYHFFDERIMRLIGDGVCLSQTVIRLRSPSESASFDAEMRKLVEPIVKSVNAEVKLDHP